MVNIDTSRVVNWYPLELVPISVDLQLAAVIVTLQGHHMHEAANGAALIFPAPELVFPPTDVAGADHVAAVTRGILFSGAI